MAKKKGSANLGRLFGAEGKVTKAGLAKAVANVNQEYKIVKWWWFGQPAIDMVAVDFDLSPTQLGGAVREIANLQGSGVNVGMEVFPYGIPKLNGSRLSVKAQINLKR